MDEWLVDIINYLCDGKGGQAAKMKSLMSQLARLLVVTLNNIHM